MRTLPIRVAPIDGEAIDSWIETLAYRTHTAFADLLAAVGLSKPNGTGTSRWIVQLAAEEKALIHAVTGVTPATLEAMTLQHHADPTAGAGAGSRAPSRAFPWGYKTGSRFCPACLTATRGRWQLVWRLGWAFACTRHHCLLVDACWHCGGKPRLRTPIGQTIPQPGFCAHPAAGATGTSPQRCGADLRVTRCNELDPDHPVLRAQRIVYSILNCETSGFGVYQTRPQQRDRILADIRAIAGRVLTHATDQDLSAVIPPDLLDAHLDHAVHKARRSEPRRDDGQPGRANPRRAPALAVGVVIALQILENSDIASAGDTLRWLVSSSRQRGLAVRATNIGWGQNTSPLLCGVQLAALRPMLKPSDQLRYRTWSPMPTMPADTGSPPEKMPSMLWPTWSLPLAIPGCDQRHLRPALSAAVLLVNSKFSMNEAAHSIGSPVNGHAVSRVLQILENQDHWPDIGTAITQMAQYLTDHHIPIDYQRRRMLDYTTLLPNKTWARICRDTATPGPSPVRARVARCYLFERLSGLPANQFLWAVDNSVFRSKVAEFPQHLTPALASALDQHAFEFLGEQGVDQEPLVWYPPRDPLNGLSLPGFDPDMVDLDKLHRVMTVDRPTLGAAAHRLGTSRAVVRYLIEKHPAAVLAPATGSEALTNGNHAYVTAKTALSHEHLVDLYETQKMSLRDVGATVGVSRQVITKLARDYDILLRPPGPRWRTTIDRDWLYDQYVNKRRTLPDIAHETGMSTSNIARWAVTYDIPMRRSGGRGHRAVCEAADAAATAPDLIKPVLGRVGGWRRLQSLETIAAHPTITAAAKHLGISQVALTNQINRTERELGLKLLVRATSGRPMQFTEHGAQVLAVVRACQHDGRKLRHDVDMLSPSRQQSTDDPERL